MNFNKPYDKGSFLTFLDDFLPDDLTFSEESLSLNIKTQYTKAVKKLGEVKSLRNLKVIEVRHQSEHDPRVSVTREIFKLMSEYTYQHALVVFYSDVSENYRISYVKMQPKIEDGELKKEKSNPRRYSFYLGPDAKIATPYNFLKEKGRVDSVEDLENRFNVEVVNKMFYQNIANLFSRLVGKENENTEYELKLPTSKTNYEARQQFTVRLIGRIIFCWFLREKESAAGVPLVPKEVLSKAALEKRDGYYHQVLEPLFFELLNKWRSHRKEDFKTDVYNQIPYLNGGLFTPQDNDYYTSEEKQAINNNIVDIPDEWLAELFDILELYNFTIDENTSFDVDLSIDPEMLGRIFENLLAEKINPETKENARNSSGSFYTPREIVDYMVDASLTEHLKEKTNISIDKIEALISHDLTDDEDHPLTEKEAQTVVDVLSELTILDPACGSGAFPIGALQKIVFMLQQADPDAELWLESQIDDVPPEMKAKIKREFEADNHDYLRKSAVIRESIYGVDIQPVAIEIARLRCFLTLIVDERVDDEAENRGIEPLPNLEFKFVTANTLKKLPEEESRQADLFEADEGIEKLSRLRDSYFSASAGQRDRLEKEINRTQKDMLNYLIDIGSKSSERSKALSNWEPFTNQKSEWFDPEWMFGEEAFDIVIGNPPYIQLQKDSGKLANMYLNQNYNTFERTGDIYSLFYERGIMLTKENTGLLTYITSNKWMRAGYGESLREYFSGKNPLKLLDFGGFKVFESATVDTSILLIKNEENQDELEAAHFEDDYKRGQDIRDYVEGNKVSLPKQTSDTWHIASKEELDLKKKIEKIGKRIKEIDVSIHRGIITGGDKVFIISQDKYNSLTSEDLKNEKILEPVLKGADIMRYECSQKRYLINTHNGYVLSEGDEKKAVNIGNYPSIKSYLDSHWDDIDGRYNQGDTPYNLRSCSFIEEFNKQKIVWGNIASEGSFCLTEPGVYVNAPANMLTSDSISLKLLIGIMNSIVFSWLFSQIGIDLGRSFEWKKQYINEIMVPPSTEQGNQKIEMLVEKIQEKKKAGKDSNELENKVDELVMDLYELTDEEKEIIRNS